MPRPRRYLHPIAEDLGDALDNRQPQSHPFAVGGAAYIQLVEFKENRLQAVGGNAASGVPHLQPQLVAPAPRRQQDAAALGVAAGIAEEVAQDPRHQPQVGEQGKVTEAHPQPQPRRLGHRLELGNQGREHFIQAVGGQVRLHRRLIEPGNIQQVGEQVLGAFQGLVGAFHQQLLRGRQAALAQGGNQQACGIQRLQQVVAGGGQVLVLAAVGCLGGVPGLAQVALDALAPGDLLLQVAVGVQQLIGARRHPLLQLVVELFQVLLGQLALGNVGDEPFHQPVLVGLEQQVHQHIDAAAVLAPQLGFVTQQAALVLQLLADGRQFPGAAHEQVARQVGQGKQHFLGVLIPQHARQGRVGGTHAGLQAGLEDAVHCVLEQPLVAVALGFQVFQARRQFRVMALARRVVAQPQEPGQGPLLFVRGPRHRPPRHHAGWIHEGW